MVQRSSLWNEIARDRLRRQTQAERADRIHGQVARELALDAHRERLADGRAEKARQKQIAEAERHESLAEADVQTARLAARIDELTGVLGLCSTQVPLTVDELVRPTVAHFDPGADGTPVPVPRRPVLEDGGLLGRGRRKREFTEAMGRYTATVADHERGERDRVGRLNQRRADHERRGRDLHADARRRGVELRNLLSSGEENAIEEFGAAAIRSLPLPDGIDLEPRVAYRADPRELVVDLRLPDFDVVPVEKSVQYVHTRRAFTVKQRSRTDIHAVYLRLLAQLPLCVLRALFGAMESDLLDSVTVNGILPARDPETGQPTSCYLVSVTTSRTTFDGLVLSELDPVRCLRYLGAKLSKHPLDLEEVAPFLTFDLAKYRLAESVDVAAGLDSTTNLGEIEWGEFEQLVRQLLMEMTGAETRVTRRSRDDGIDGVLFDCNVVLGGEFVVQVKRYRKVVPANDIRALAGVMHDKRANHAIFVTPSWFSDDGRRFASDNRVRLIEGPELKQLLRQHLGLKVVIPLRRRRGTST